MRSRQRPCAVRLLRVSGPLVLVALVACVAEKPVEPVDRKAVAGQIRSAFLEFKTHLNEGDFDSALGFYADDPRFVAYEDGVERYGSFDEIREIYGQLESYGPARFDYTEPTITVLSSDSAMLATEFSTSFGPVDAPSFSFAGVLTAVVVRTEGDWKMLIIHSSTRQPSGADSYRSSD